MLQGDSTVVGTSKLRDLYERFEEELVGRQRRAKAARPRWEPPKTKLDEDPGGCWQLPGLEEQCRHLSVQHQQFNATSTES